MRARQASSAGQRHQLFATARVFACMARWVSQSGSGGKSVGASRSSAPPSHNVGAFRSRARFPDSSPLMGEAGWGWRLTKNSAPAESPPPPQPLPHQGERVRFSGSIAAPDAHDTRPRMNRIDRRLFLASTAAAAIVPALARRRRARREARCRRRAHAGRNGRGPARRISRECELARPRQGQARAALKSRLTDRTSKDERAMPARRGRGWRGCERSTAAG